MASTLAATIEEERAFRATVRDRLTEVLRALAADLDLSAFALLQVREGGRRKRKEACPHTSFISRKKSSRHDDDAQPPIAPRCLPKSFRPAPRYAAVHAASFGVCLAVRGGQARAWRRAICGRRGEREKGAHSLTPRLEPLFGGRPSVTRACLLLAPPMARRGPRERSRRRAPAIASELGERARENELQRDEARANRRRGGGDSASLGRPLTTRSSPLPQTNRSGSARASPTRSSSSPRSRPPRQAATNSTGNRSTRAWCLGGGQQQQRPPRHRRRRRPPSTPPTPTPTTPPLLPQAPCASSPTLRSC